MDSAYISALAALAGSVIGGLTSLAASWVSQSYQARTQHLLGDKLRRQELYRMFIEEASKLYAEALSTDKAELSNMINLYAMANRMRVISTPPVADSADNVVHMIVESYFGPNLTLQDFRDPANRHRLDPLRHFSEACHQESVFLARTGG